MKKRVRRPTLKEGASLLMYFVDKVHGEKDFNPITLVEKTESAKKFIFAVMDLEQQKGRK